MLDGIAAAVGHSAVGHWLVVEEEVLMKTTGKNGPIIRQKKQIT
jgi:hypothetical protein